MRDAVGRCAVGDVLVVLLACVAGGLGAVLRHLVDVTVQRFVADDYPWGIFAVNVLGSFAAGLVVKVAVGLQEPASERLVLLVGLGLLGGFTTFSTAMVQSLRLGAGRGGIEATVHAAGTWLACVSAAALGMALVG